MLKINQHVTKYISHFNTVLKTLNSHRVIHGSWERVFGNCLREIAIFVDVWVYFHDSLSLRMVLSVNAVRNWNINVSMMYFIGVPWTVGRRSLLIHNVLILIFGWSKSRDFRTLVCTNIIWYTTMLQAPKYFTVLHGMFNFACIR